MRTISSPRIGPATPGAEAGHDDRSRGQALVEFAIVLPVFFLLVAGMFDFGLGIYSDLTLVNAAREGARLGVIDPGNTSAIEARVRAMSGGLDDGKLRVTVACERPSGSSFTSCTSPMWLPGDATKVTVDYKYSMFFPILFGTEDPALVRIEDADRIGPTRFSLRAAFLLEAERHERHRAPSSLPDRAAPRTTHEPPLLGPPGHDLQPTTRHGSHGPGPCQAERPDPGPLRDLLHGDPGHGGAGP